MRRLILLLLLLIASVYLGLNVIHHPGYLLVVYQPWMVQMPLWFALISAIFLFVIFFWLISSIDRLQFYWFRFKNWLKLRKEHRLYSKTQQGLACLIEGQWSKAEYLLKNGVQETIEPLMNYLGAAKAAHEQKAFDRRDSYIRLAHQAAPDASLAIGLTQAELEFSQENSQRAVAILQHLRQVSPKHPGVLKFLEKIYVHTADWENLQAMLPDLRRAKIISREELQKFEKNIYCERLRANNTKDPKYYLTVWAQVPKQLRKHPEVVQAYLSQLLKKPSEKDYSEAAELIRKVLSHTWNEALAQYYASLPVTDINHQLVLVGAWLKQYGQKPVLLLTLGRLCVRAQLWGKAKDYFAKCLAIGASPQASLEYGKLLDHLGEKQAALTVFEEGLRQQVVSS